MAEELEAPPKPGDTTHCFDLAMLAPVGWRPNVQATQAMAGSARWLLAGCCTGGRRQSYRGAAACGNPEAQSRSRPLPRLRKAETSPDTSFFRLIPLMSSKPSAIKDPILAPMFLTFIFNLPVQPCAKCLWSGSARTDGEEMSFHAEPDLPTESGEKAGAN